jgi:hypothetical protein
MHCVERLANRAEELQNKIKKNTDNKSLARQLIAGARENADYSCQNERWSPEWYIQFIKELESRAN